MVPLSVFVAVGVCVAVKDTVLVPVLLNVPD
jgi:hypothetical protein